MPGCSDEHLHEEGSSEIQSCLCYSGDQPSGIIPSYAHSVPASGAKGGAKEQLIPCFLLPALTQDTGSTTIPFALPFSPSCL